MCIRDSLSTGFVFAGVAPLVSAYFQALGSPAPSYLISVGTLLLLKVPLVLALGALGPLGIWIALPAGEALAATAAVVILRWRAAQERPPRPGPGDEDRRGRGRRRRSR